MPSITAPAPSPVSSPPSADPEAGFGLYVHWPFCAAKCPYCDFNSHVVAKVDQRRWAGGLAAEIARAATELPERRLTSIFFGGGTPSLMAPETVEAVLAAARRAWLWSNDIEITLEANPGSVEAGRFRAYRHAGVDRVSLGVQALNDRDLRALGRLHDAAEARAAVEVAQATFERVSIDLIYARQNQEAAEWRRELDEALALGTDHLSLYQLTIEDGTAFADRLRRGGLRGLPTEDLGATLYEVTQDVCARAGRPAYEVSNHAASGAESRHNLTYWRCGDWVGVGPGAHGRFWLDGRRIATAALSAPGAWLVAVEAGGRPEERDVVEDPWKDYFMMGLRLREGILLSRFEALGGRLDEGHVAELVEAELLERCDGRLRTTSAGRPLLNAILRRLL